MQYKIAEAKHKTSKKWRTHDITWEAFVDRLRSPLRTPETVKEYRQMPKEQRDAAKEAAGGFIGGALSDGQRKSDHIVSRSFITLDADHAATDSWEQALMLCDEWTMAAYTTHSHTPEQPRLRYVLPADRPITPDEYPAVARKVAECIGIEQMDPTTYEIARMMYWPTACRDGEYLLRECIGQPIHVDEVLASYGDNDAWRDAELWPTAKSEVTVREHSVKVAGDPLTKEGTVGLFCRTYDIPTAIAEFLPDIYSEEDNGRYTFNGGSTHGGAVVYNDGRFLYSNHATDPCSGQSVNAFDLVRIHKFGDMDSVTGEDTPVTKLPSYREMCKWCITLPEVKEQLIAERAAENAEYFSDINGNLSNQSNQSNLNCVKQGANDVIAGKNDDIAGDKDWMHKLTINAKTNEVERTQPNAELILEHDPILKGVLEKDVFAKRKRISKSVPWRKVISETDRYYDVEVDWNGFRSYMQRMYNFDSDNNLKGAIEIVAHNHGYHPVRNYLDSLVWDGVKRLDTVLIDFFGASDTEYTRAISRKWFTAAVARIYQPGCKFDSCLVAYGPQGTGKSSFLQILAHDLWYNDSKVSIGQKDGYEILKGVWLVEFGEFRDLKRNELEAVKQYISSSTDRYRKAYGAEPEQIPRQCVFYATTNEFEILRDSTGERRFWVFDVNKSLDQKALRRVRDQLWAEAVVNYRENYLTGKEELYISEDDGTALDEWHDTIRLHSTQDDLIGELEEFLNKPLPLNYYDLDLPTRRNIMTDTLIDDDLPMMGAGGATEAQPTMLRETVSLAELRWEFLGCDVKGSANGRDSHTFELSRRMNSLPGWRKLKNARHVKGYGKQTVYERLV